MKIGSFFNLGFRSMLPITTGIIPFGVVVGTVSHEAQLTIFETVAMNVLVFAGASQLAAIELMTEHAASIVVIVTGLIINLRFLLYSAAISPVIQKLGFWDKFFCAYMLTDQTYAVMSAQQKKLQTPAATIEFYFGSAICMVMTWHLSVVAGFIFGNIAPAAWALEYAVPLSFVALVIPTLADRRYYLVAAFSSFVSVVLNPLPFKLGLLITALASIGLAVLISKPRLHP